MNSTTSAILNSKGIVSLAKDIFNICIKGIQVITDVISITQIHHDMDRSLDIRSIVLLTRFFLFTTTLSFFPYF